MTRVHEAFDKAREVSHPPILRLYAQSVNAEPGFCAHWQTSGSSATLLAMEMDDQDDGGPLAQNILGENLNSLYAQAKRQWAVWKKTNHDAGESPPPPASDNALEAKSGVSRKTLAAIRNDGRPAQLDTLDAIARAYKLRAYQLLVPGLDLDNPVTVPVTETEREMVRAFRESMRRIKEGERDDAGEGSEAAGNRGDSKGTKGGKKVGASTK